MKIYAHPYADGSLGYGPTDDHDADVDDGDAFNWGYAYGFMIDWGWMAYILG